MSNAITKSGGNQMSGYLFVGGQPHALVADNVSDELKALGFSTAGIVYSFDSTRQLVATTGPAFAKYLLFSGNRVNASHALRVGLFDELVDPADLQTITTDFATTIAGVPVNMPTHAHGQGYTDLNFVIPELVSGVQYRKGTYSVEDGDFSSAGSAHIAYRNTVPSPIASL